MKPKLWIDEAGVERLRSHRDHPLVQAVLAKAREILAKGEGDSGVVTGSPGRDTASDLLQCLVVLRLIEDASGLEAKSEALAITILEDEVRSDLGRAYMAMNLAMAYDFLADEWSESGRIKVREWLASFPASLDPVVAETSGGNPDNPFNNWWGVTHSAAGLACMAVRDEVPEVLPALKRSRERVRRYLCNWGEGGHYYEGMGYGGYALSQVLPFTIASEFADGVDLMDLNDGARKYPVLYAAISVPRERVFDTDHRPGRQDGIGMMLNWNDSGGQASISGLYFPLPEKKYLPGLKWMFDHFGGLKGDGSLCSPRLGLLWTTLFYPYHLPDEAVCPELPRTMVDHRTGLVVYRNRYEDGEDCVFGAYAKVYHPGGHAHQDAGSWSFTGLGSGWSQAGGQAKFGPEFQSALMLDGKQLRKVPFTIKTGELSDLHPNETGGSVSMRVGKCYGAKLMDRYFAVDYSGAAGVPALLANVDSVWDDEEREWSWTLSYEHGLEASLEPEKNGFSIQNGDVSMVVRFITPAELKFEDLETPGTQRTYSGGTTVKYYGSRYVKASVRAAKTDFFCVMSLQRGTAPELEVEGEGLDAVVRVGEAKIWFQKGKWFNGPVRIESV